MRGDLRYVATYTVHCIGRAYERGTRFTLITEGVAIHILVSRGMTKTRTSIVISEASKSLIRRLRNDSVVVFDG